MQCDRGEPRSKFPYPCQQNSLNRLLRTKEKMEKFSQRFICNISAEVPTVYLSVWLLSYLSTVCVHRTGLCCLLVLAEPPPHYTRPHTGLQLCHRSSVQVMQCRCSYCCCPTTLSHSCGCCQNCASAPVENYRPSCRAWRPKDSMHLNTHI